MKTSCLQLGVILSGSASDGALGIGEIKAKGGITFAQDVQSAKFHSMFQNAIATGFVDFVLPAKQIALQLEKVARHEYIKLNPPDASRFFEQRDKITKRF